MTWTNFTREEFSCNCGCNANDIKDELVDRLQVVRQLFDKPMKINSGHRCKKSNGNAGSGDTSSHLIGEASDISCVSSKDRYELIGLLRKQFNRIGVHKEFIHVDISDDKKASPCLWVY